MSRILNKRIYAFIVDLGVIYFLKFFSLILYLKTIGFFLTALPIANKQKLFTNLNLLNNYLFIVIFIGYFLSCFFITNGRTLGKFLFNLKLVTSKEEETFIDQYLIRTFTYLFCYLNGVFLLFFPLFTKDEKGLPDWLSGTMVINDSEERIKPSEYNQNEAFNLKKIL
jgi:uncharacterized RDD family membrane protein YckC